MEIDLSFTLPWIEHPGTLPPASASADKVNGYWRAKGLGRALA